jgi:DinB superfamily
MDSHLKELKQAVESALDGMSMEQMNWHPPEKWCASEVLEHLYLTYTGTIKEFEKMRDSGSGKALGTRPSLRQRARMLVVLGLNYMPTGRESPATAKPRGLPVEKVRDEIGMKIVAMDEIISECEARFGRNVTLLDHPILGPLTGAQWRKFHLVHGRHHIKQILQLRARQIEAK